MELFASNEILPLTLTAKLGTLLNDRGDDRIEHPATIAYLEADGTESIQGAKVKVRGNFRRQAHNCNFPPLRLNFSKKKTTGTLFEGQDKIKLVNPCKKESSLYQDYLLLEYLTYRIYNQISPLSFKVRLVEMTFEEMEKEKSKTSYGFLIQDEEAVALQNGGEILDRQMLHPKAVDPHQLALVSLFQYMIGNTDWYIPQLHNVKLVRLPVKATPYPVPYDFDHAGFVNAQYASPHVNLPIKRVTQRYYRGYCHNQEELAQLIDLFNEKSASIYALVEDFELLSKRAKKNAISYLDGFYKTINNPKQVRKAFINKCQKLD